MTLSEECLRPYVTFPLLRNDRSLSPSITDIRRLPSVFVTCMYISLNHCTSSPSEGILIIFSSLCSRWDEDRTHKVILVKFLPPFPMTACRGEVAGLQATSSRVRCLHAFRDRSYIVVSAYQCSVRTVISREMTSWTK